MISVLGNEQDLHMHSATALLYPMKRIQMTRHVWKMYCFQVLELTSIASSRVFFSSWCSSFISISRGLQKVVPDFTDCTAE